MPAATFVGQAAHLELLGGTEAWKKPTQDPRKESHVEEGDVANIERRRSRQIGLFHTPLPSAFCPLQVGCAGPRRDHLLCVFAKARLLLFGGLNWGGLSQ